VTASIRESFNVLIIIKPIGGFFDFALLVKEFAVDQHHGGSGARDSEGVADMLVVTCQVPN